MEKTLGVFCGSSLGESPVYQEQAQALGQVLLKQRISLVYGGSNAGLMGVLASEVMKGGGRVIGIIPSTLAERTEPLAVTELHVVSTMHERKKMMYDFSDAFLALPGGLGTLDEIFEALTWTQLGIHQKPCGFLNINGYYDHLLEFLDHSVKEGFVKPPHRQMIHSADTPAALVDTLFSAPPAEVSKW